MKKLFLSILFIGISYYSIAQIEKAKENYNQAFNELHKMLKGEIPLSFKRAVFITENTYLENQLSYEDFQKQIDALVKLTNAVAANDGLIYDKKDRRQVLMAGAIYRVMKDSLVFESPDKSLSFKKYPYTYDMDDFWGEREWTKMFVTKLLYDQTGNCHSFPALYKIIADELGIEAWLSIAPNHTYIKQWNDKTGWYNTELTTGRFPFDAELKHNSYIKTDAIAAGVYMDTLSTKETISYAITDLAQGYVKMFGYDDIATPVKWLDTALVYFSNYPNAMILKAELLKRQYEQVMKEKGATEFSELWEDPTIKSKFIELEQSYYNVHQIGYRRMPREMYLNWLFRVNKDSTRKPYVFQTPQPFKKHNYKVLVMTAGNGENYEFFDQEETTRIGTVEINRRTKKIVKFIEPEEDDMPDEVIGRMYDPTVGRFWQVDPMAQERDWLSPYNFVQNNPINRVDPTGALDWVANADGEIYWDKNANSQETTKQGETYLGKDLTFTFNSYINSTFDGAQPPWEVTGDKLTSTISLTSNEDSDGNLQSVDVTSSYSIGETGGLSIFKGRDFFPGLGDNQNQSINLNDVKSFSATFEQHASVPGLEAAGLNMLGYDIVNVAQKMTLGLSGNKLSVSAATDIFPSATLSVNGTQLFQYNQPSFRATHGRDTRFSDNGVGGVAGESVPRRPAPSFYQRYKK